MQAKFTVSHYLQTSMGSMTNRSVDLFKLQTKLYMQTIRFYFDNRFWWFSVLYQLWRSTNKRQMLKVFL